MKTFILKARKAPSNPKDIPGHIGQNGHIEIIAHAIMNSFFIAQGFREDVTLCIVFDSTQDFPRTLCLNGSGGLSFTGFHEAAFYDFLTDTLSRGHNIQHQETRPLLPGVTLYGFGLETLLKTCYANQPVCIMHRKGTPITECALPENPVFLLTDHIPMPVNLMKSLKRRGAHTLSLGRKVLLASQCITLIHGFLDMR